MKNKQLLPFGVVEQYYRAGDVGFPCIPILSSAGMRGGGRVFTPPAWYGMLYSQLLTVNYH